ncbi:Transglutaminase-like enzyme, putative cysteine protease [Arboricoccus pini]|uniref:Transglutaminase-like enzyme, putative cysteine protease n=1 Tax=Arboricoccus pini TaxID=1963835 RepID=A0A212R3D2_9PROT|nr:transglutaminase family protein [Arboricoccus pini]SNB66544.1 Transglutaminase-like enzyme, putative cysteine protease [Arboricoccus pini]
MAVFIVRHRTHYHYSEAVTLGPQRLVIRPRDSHDLRLLDATLMVSPPASRTRWLHDIYDNSIAILEFEGTTQDLIVESRLLIDNYGYDKPRLPVEPFAETWPFDYRAEEAVDLEPWTRRQFKDPEGRLTCWVRQLVNNKIEYPTQDLLVAMMRRIKDELPYSVRYEEGIRNPLETLEKGGTCRDFAVLMIEAARILGFAARFVSGYLYVPPVQIASDRNGEQSDHDKDDAAAGVPLAAPIVGGGSTHAWVQIYLPGAGWVEFDPTNALYGGADLVRIAIAREPALVSPVSGSFKGPLGIRATLKVDVDVQLLKDEPIPERLS